MTVIHLNQQTNLLVSNLLVKAVAAEVSRPLQARLGAGRSYFWYLPIGESRWRIVRIPRRLPCCRGTPQFYI